MYRTAVVTGASTGIGRATALRLAAEGLAVFGTVRSESSGADLLEAAGQLDAAGAVHLVVVDVDDDESVTAGMAEVLDRVDTVDVLVNNAGISGSGSVEDMDLATFWAQMNTNAFGTLRCTKALLPTMRAAGRGAIANVTSVAGRVPAAGMGAYNMSKHAQEALTECLAHELALHGIRVVAIEPGVVRTPIFAKSGDRTAPPSPPYEGQARRILANFVGALSADPATPDHVAEVIWRAITDDEHRLRHPATPDGERAMARRAEASDEEWLAASTVADDEAWAAWQSEVRGYPVAISQE